MPSNCGNSILLCPWMVNKSLPAAGNERSICSPMEDTTSVDLSFCSEIPWLLPPDGNLCAFSLISDPTEVPFLPEPTELYKVPLPEMRTEQCWLLLPNGCFDKSEKLYLWIVKVWKMNGGKHHTSSGASTLYDKLLTISQSANREGRM